MIDASAITEVYLSFGDLFFDPSNGTVATIQVSNDGGNNWHTVFTYKEVKGFYPNAFRTVVNLTAYAAGYSAVKIKFSCKNSIPLVIFGPLTVSLSVIMNLAPHLLTAPELLRTTEIFYVQAA
jgi:hypothetical protein